MIETKKDLPGKQCFFYPYVPVSSNSLEWLLKSSRSSTKLNYTKNDIFLLAVMTQLNKIYFYDRSY